MGAIPLCQLPGHPLIRYWENISSHCFVKHLYLNCVIGDYVMRRLKKQKPLAYDNTLLTLEPEAEIIEIIKAKRAYKGFRLDRHHTRFLKYESRRLGWSEAAVVRGILNMYIEEARLAERDDALNSRYWVGRSDRDFEEQEGANIVHPRSADSEEESQAEL